MPKIKYDTHPKYNRTETILPSCTEILLNLWTNFCSYCSFLTILSCVVLCCSFFFVHYVLYSCSCSCSDFYLLFSSRTHSQHYLPLIATVVGYDFCFFPVVIQQGHFQLHLSFFPDLLSVEKKHLFHSSYSCCGFCFD